MIPAFTLGLGWSEEELLCAVDLLLTMGYRRLYLIDMLSVIGQQPQRRVVERVLDLKPEVVYVEVGSAAALRGVEGIRRVVGTEHLRDENDLDRLRHAGVIVSVDVAGTQVVAEGPLKQHSPESVFAILSGLGFKEAVLFEVKKGLSQLAVNRMLLQRCAQRFLGDLIYGGNAVHRRDVIAAVRAGARWVLVDARAILEGRIR